jgi:putative transposase
MVRIARVVAPGVPHHITQRGNRRQATFFCAEDYHAYLALLREWCGHWKVEIWAYCLMPNHVHLLAVPMAEDALRRAIGEAHRRYTRRVNFREGWRGHLWQGRFASCPLDEPHMLAAARYIEQNPVRAGLAATPWDYPWSSAAAHVAGRDDVLVKVAPLLAQVNDWKGFLATPVTESQVRELRRHERSGRPVGHEHFVLTVERTLGRTLRRGKPGPKRSQPM